MSGISCIMVMLKTMFRSLMFSTSWRFMADCLNNWNASMRPFTFTGAVWNFMVLLEQVHKSQVQVIQPTKFCWVAPNFVVSHYGSYFMSLSWNWEFWGNCWIFGKFVHPCTKKCWNFLTPFCLQLLYLPKYKMTFFFS